MRRSCRARSFRGRSSPTVRRGVQGRPRQCACRGSVPAAALAATCDVALAGAHILLSKRLPMPCCRAPGACARGQLHSADV